MYQGQYPGNVGEVQIRMKVDIFTEGPNEGLDFYQSVNTGHPNQTDALPHQHFRVPSSLPQGPSQPMIQWPETTSESDRTSASKGRRKKKSRSRNEDPLGSKNSLSSSKPSGSRHNHADPVARRRRRSRDELPDPLAYQRAETPSHPRTDPSSEDTLQTSKDDSFGTDRSPSRQRRSPATRPNSFGHDFLRPTSDPIVSFPSEPSIDEPEPDLIVTPQDVTINTFEQQSLLNSQLSAPPSRSNPSPSTFSFDSTHLHALIQPTRQDLLRNPTGDERRVIRQIDERITTTTMKLAQVQLPHSTGRETTFETRPPQFGYPYHQDSHPWRPSSSTSAPYRPNYSEKRTDRKPEAAPRQLRVSFSSLPDSRGESPIPGQEPPLPHTETLIDDPGYSFEDEQIDLSRLLQGDSNFHSTNSSIPHLESEPRALRPVFSRNSRDEDPPPAESTEPPQNLNSFETLIDESLPPAPSRISHERRETLIDDVIEIDCEETYALLHTESSSKEQFRAPPVGRSEEDQDSSVSSLQNKGIALIGSIASGEDDDTLSQKTSGSSSTEIGQCDHDFKIVQPQDHHQNFENDSLASERSGQFGWVKRLSFHESSKTPEPEPIRNEPPEPSIRIMPSSKIFDIYTKPLENSSSIKTSQNQKTISYINRVPLATQEDDHVADSASDVSFRNQNTASAFNYAGRISNSRTEPYFPRSQLGPSLQGRPSSRSPSDNQGSTLNSQSSKAGAVYANPEYLDENLSDYLQARLSPLGKEMGNYADSTLSKDSVVSEASYRADRSHGFFDKDVAPESSLDRREQRRPAKERSFAEIMNSSGEDSRTKGLGKPVARLSGSSTSLSSYGSLRQDSVRHAPVLNRPPMGDLGRGGLYGEAKIGMAQLGHDRIPFTQRWDSNKNSRSGGAPTAL